MSERSRDISESLLTLAFDSSRLSKESFSSRFCRVIPRINNATGKTQENGEEGETNMERPIGKGTLSESESERMKLDK